MNRRRSIELAYLIMVAALILTLVILLIATHDSDAANWLPVINAGYP